MKTKSFSFNESFSFALLAFILILNLLTKKLCIRLILIPFLIFFNKLLFLHIKSSKKENILKYKILNNLVLV